MRSSKVAAALSLACAAATSLTPTHSIAAGCTPGQQVSCGCPGAGMTGVQTCEDSGKRFGACACSTSESPATPCKKDADCPKAASCKKGVCETAAGKDAGAGADAGAGKCERDGECSGDDVCVEGVCKAPAPAPAASEPPPPAPAASASDGGLTRCESDLQCPPTHWCVDTVCAPRSKRVSPNMMAGGIVMTSIGGLGLLGYFGVGMALYPNHATGHPEATIPIAAVGVGLVVTGIILIVKGGAKRPAFDPPAQGASAGVRVQPTVLPHGVGLSGTF